MNQIRVRTTNNRKTKGIPFYAPLLYQTQLHSCFYLLYLSFPLFSPSHYPLLFLLKDIALLRLQLLFGAVSSIIISHFLHLSILKHRNILQQKIASDASSSSSSSLYCSAFLFTFPPLPLFCIIFYDCISMPTYGSINTDTYCQQYIISTKYK